MATPVVKCKLSNQEEFKITSVEDIDEVFTKNDIIPHYREHLVQVNTCLALFKELETNRTWGEWFTDWNYGARNEINRPRLIDNLNGLKEALMEGLTQYTRLLSEKDELKKVFRELMVSKIDLDITHEMIESNTDFKKGADYIFGSSPLMSVMVELLAKLTDTVSALAAIGIGVGVGVVAGGLLYGIHLLAKSYGEKRGLKYQQVKAISDAFDANFLGKIEAYHEDLSTIFINLEDIRKSEKQKDLRAYKLYTKSKDESFNQLKREGNDDYLCEKISKKLALKETESYLIYELKCSKEEAEEICKDFQK